VPHLDEGNYKKLIASILMAAHPTGPYPITVIEGQQDTGKTTIARYVRALLDPRSKERSLRTLATSPRDLWVQAFNERILFFDNVTRIPHVLEDEMCQISTGGAFGSRANYTDDRQVVLDAKRPIFITCIHMPTTREDLLSRIMNVRVSPVPTDKRRSERELDAEFDRQRAKLFGGLCRALASSLKVRKATPKSAGSVRMQDALEFVTGAEKELGWPPGTFGRIYGEDQQELMDSVLEDDPLARAVVQLVQRPLVFRGTATQLLRALERHRAPGQRLPNHYRLTERLRRLIPLLKRKGIAVEETRTSDKRRDRIILIRRAIRIPKAKLSSIKRMKIVPKRTLGLTKGFVTRT
jgi:putative DNA primase/helicase